MEENNKLYPEGHFVWMWMGIGSAIGVAIGLAVGSSIEARYQQEGKIRPLSEKEKRRQK